MAATTSLPPEAEEVLQVFRQSHRPMTAYEVADAMGRSYEDIEPAIRLLRSREVIRRVSNGPHSPRYGLLRRP